MSPLGLRKKAVSSQLNTRPGSWVMLKWFESSKKVSTSIKHRRMRFSVRLFQAQVRFWEIIGASSWCPLKNNSYHLRQGLLSVKLVGLFSSLTNSWTLSNSIVFVAGNPQAAIWFFFLSVLRWFLVHISYLPFTLSCRLTWVFYIVY